MKKVIEYKVINPAILITLIEKSVPRAVCTYCNKENEMFEISIIGWSMLTLNEYAIIQKIISRYVKNA